VVIVDDDSLFRESVRQNLSDSGFEVIDFDDGRAALDYLSGDEHVSLVLLDWKMPEMSGIEVLRELREIKPDLPIIFLTVLGDQIYEEAALIGGAVDFIEKSRSFSILLRRMELILGGDKARERAAGDGLSDERFSLGPLELRSDTSRAYWQSQRLSLTLTEFQMVQYLATRAGEDVSYRELYDLVHGKEFIAGDGPEGHRANVRTFIKRIRQKFRDVDGEFDQIENYAGFGYRWKDDRAQRA
jgi:two-component system response regulator ChvI